MFVLKIAYLKLNIYFRNPSKGLVLLSEQDINQRDIYKLKCKCAFHLFSFIEQEQGWTDINYTLDPLLFYQDKLHLIQKGNINLSETIKTATAD